MTADEFTKFCNDMQKMIKDMRKQFNAVRKNINGWRWKFAEIQIQWGNAKTMWEKFKLLLSGLSNIKVNFRVHKVDRMPDMLIFPRFVLDAPKQNQNKPSRKKPVDPRDDTKAARTWQSKVVGKPLDKKMRENVKNENLKLQAEIAKFEAEREKWRLEREAYESRNVKPNQDDESAKTIGQLLGNIDKNFGWIFTMFGALGNFSKGYSELKKGLKGGRDAIRRMQSSIKSASKVISGFIDRIAVLLGAMGKTNAITLYR